jgi:hypothetical protein
VVLVVPGVRADDFGGGGGTGGGMRPPVGDLRGCGVGGFAVRAPPAGLLAFEEVWSAEGGGFLVTEVGLGDCFDGNVVILLSGSDFDFASGWLFEVDGVKPSLAADILGRISLTPSSMLSPVSVPSSEASES